MVGDTIAIFFDSNMLFAKGSHDYSCVWSHSHLDNYIDKIEALELYENVKVVIPSIVLEELNRQQLEAAKDMLARLSGLTIPRWEPDGLPTFEDYKNWLYEKHDQFVAHNVRGMVSYEIVYPPQTCFDCLIQRALEKRAPFEGKQKESDKGFKDALIWETVLEYKRQHLREQIVWVTKDKRLSSNALCEEFQKEFGEELSICGSDQEFDEKLNCVMGLLGVDAKPLFEGESAEMLEQFLRQVVFDNLTSMLVEGDMNIDSDTRYRFKTTCSKDCNDGAFEVNGELCSISQDNVMRSCDLQFRFSKTSGSPMCACAVNGSAIDIEYDAEEALRWCLDD